MSQNTLLSWNWVSTWVAILFLHVFKSLLAATALRQRQRVE